MNSMNSSLPRFTCLFCKDCCHFSEEYEMPTVLPWEKRQLEDIAASRGVELEFKPLQIYINDNGICIVTLYRWIIRGYCPFLDQETSKCTIHEVKPLSCRMYPLILELPTGKLMVSSKCKWVAEAGKELMRKLAENPELIPRVFPQEFEAAVEAFIELKSIYDYVKSKKMKPLNPQDLHECREVIDIDEYIARYG